MANQFGSFLVVVLVPAMAVAAILRLAGAKMTTALMWGSITMAVVAFLLWLTVGGVAH